MKQISHRRYYIYNKLLLAAEKRVEVKGIAEICCFPICCCCHRIILCTLYHAYASLSLSLSPGFHRCAYARLGFLGFLLNIDVGEREELILQYLMLGSKLESSSHIYLDVPAIPCDVVSLLLAIKAPFVHNRAVGAPAHTHTQRCAAEISPADVSKEARGSVYI